MSVVPKKALAGVGATALLISVVYLILAVDFSAIGATLEAAAADPVGLAVALAAYTAAFLVRAGLWCRALPGLSFGQSLAAIHVSLAGNHLLPLRLGEPLRVVSAVRRTRVPVGAATASTVFLRAADVLAVIAIAAILGPALAHRLVGDAAIPLAMVTAVTRAASAGETGMPAQPAHDQISTLSSSQATVAPGTAITSQPRGGAPPRRTTRASQNAAATSSRLRPSGASRVSSPRMSSASPSSHVRTTR